ncbi:hypothetical protein DYBT9275_04563 [Dyadobacter sp. CECT 9275]|uniref:Adhesin domain-containing protein n=1 Tax=Dyadobacter helix TaxID=2822344 RepID=A0A916JJ84_9BACT|nr:DUF4097 family beta strand repeat-containing protein [Dyadobacter sp. CECT 9275]CAG5009755.1 hypothetical protein DYBT9275_04563 [Dyadobacter sp. CECT 9275]
MKIIVTLLLFNLAAATYALDANPQTVEKRRNIIKEFDVKEKEVLALDNQFGLVKVNLWNKKEIKVEILIMANASSDSRASDYLNTVEIEETREKNKISLVTVINKGQFGSSFWNNNQKGDKDYLQINYTVYMPRENPLTVRNRFGDTDIPVFYAPLTIETKHGNFIANTLESTENTIDVKYGSAKIGKIANCKMDFQYSNLKLDQVRKLMLNNKSGELNIGDVTSLDADIDYSGAKIGTIRGPGKIRLNYSGNFKIEEMTNSVENLDIQASYSSIILPAESNRFNVTVSYGNFSYPAANVNFSMQPSKEDKANKVRQYQGTVGSGSGKKITIVSRYGDVRLKE